MIENDSGVYDTLEWSQKNIINEWSEFLSTAALMEQKNIKESKQKKQKNMDRCCPQY